MRRPYLARASGDTVYGPTVRLAPGPIDDARAALCGWAMRCTPPREWARIRARIDSGYTTERGGEGRWVLGRSPAGRDTTITDVET